MVSPRVVMIEPGEPAPRARMYQAVEGFVESLEFNERGGCTVRVFGGLDTLYTGTFFVPGMLGVKLQPWVGKREAVRWEIDDGAYTVRPVSRIGEWPE
jgi:hypothetical protein